MIGLFYENGPIRMTDNMRLARNNNTWGEEYSMLFIDQPVGTGFSFVDNGDGGSKKKKDSKKDDVDEQENQDYREQGGQEQDEQEDDDNNDDDKQTPSKDDLDVELEKDQEEESAFFASLPSEKSYYFKAVASEQDRQQRNVSSFTEGGFVKDQAGVVADMLFVLDQFYERYPEQLKADLYIAGQSYGGKFVPSIAHAIVDRNKRYRQEDLLEDPCPVDTTAFPTPKKAVIPIKGISLGTPRRIPSPRSNTMPITLTILDF